jgi:predicted nucleic acid-binding protein
VVITDEQEGREFATHAGLYVSGVLGILLRAKRDGWPLAQSVLSLLPSRRQRL